MSLRHSLFRYPEKMPFKPRTKWWPLVLITDAPWLSNWTVQAPRIPRSLPYSQILHVVLKLVAASTWSAVVPTAITEAVTTSDLISLFIGLWVCGISPGPLYHHPGAPANTSPRWGILQSLLIPQTGGFRLDNTQNSFATERLQWKCHTDAGPACICG